MNSSLTTVNRSSRINPLIILDWAGPCETGLELYTNNDMTGGSSRISPVSAAPRLSSGNLWFFTCFAPEEDCTAFAVDAVDGAEREILNHLTVTRRGG